jgi:aspartate aminotransferase, cytoplasmic
LLTLLQQITSVQTISGTGANHLGALFLSKCYEQVSPQVHIGTPTWGNYEPLFRLVGFDFVPYNYYNSSRKCVDFAACIDAVKKAPRKSVFVLQGCCHNPTGADLDREQWRILAEEMKLASHVPFFDVAYQGLGDGLEQDAFGVQLFAGMGFEMVVCQSFSKNFGLYSERVGALHIVNKNEEIAANVHDQLRSLIRWEFSSAPAYGSRLVNIVLGDKEDVRDWLVLATASECSRC